MTWVTDGSFWVYGAVVGTTAIAGSLVTGRGGTERNKPYQSILTPPNWVFVVVWTILFILIFIAGYLADSKLSREIKQELDPQKREELTNKRTLIRILFGIQLGLNFLWSFSAFYLNNYGLAIIIHLALIFIIAWLLVLYFDVDRVSFGLFIPYFVWVVFALHLAVTIFVNQQTGTITPWGMEAYEKSKKKRMEKSRRKMAEEGGML